MAAINGAEVAKHSNKQSCWIVVDSNVYDVTSFLPEHPGGAAVILKNAGAVSLVCDDEANWANARGGCI